MQARLLGIDLDGTLVRTDGGVHPDDRACISALLSRGVHVSLVTGRAPLGTLAVARELALEAPCVCVDGAALLDPRSGALTVLSSLPGHAVRRALALFEELALAPFVTTLNGFHGAVEHEQMASSVSGWSPRVSLRPREALPHDRGPVLLLLGVGQRAAARLAEQALATSAGPDVACAAFPLGTEECWAVRMQTVRCTKQAGLSTVAARLGVDRRDVAFVGDWYNDVSALEWAGSSFCMGHAPDRVKAHAQQVLRATSASGGGVAEAVRLWLPAPHAGEATGVIRVDGP